ncbi:MAG TPA: hypothetical protein VGH16_09375 [Candidatus Binatia bacterium]|jgi:hypothetical protein
MHSYRSRLLPFLRAVFAVFVVAYVFFDVLDLDGSNLSSVLNPTEHAVISAETPAAVEAPHRLARANFWDVALIAPDLPAIWTRPSSLDKLPLSPLISARARGYRVGLPRDAIPG